MATKPVGDHAVSPPLKFKTWVLRVSLHCEGCQKKVKKLLQGIEGVYTTAIEAQQNKVTVTGEVDSETLIKRLERSGKHAELWPEKIKEKNVPHKSSSIKNEKQSNPKANSDTQSGKKDGNLQKSVETAADKRETGGELEEKRPETEKNGGRKKNKKKSKEVKTSDGGRDHEQNGDATTAIGSPVSPLPPTDLGPFQPPAQHVLPVHYGMSYNTAPFAGAVNSHFAAPATQMGDPVVHLPPYDPIRFINSEYDDHQDYEDETGCFIM